MKALKTLRRSLISLVAATSLFIGCFSYPTKDYSSESYLTRVKKSISLAGDREYTSMDINIPAVYGDIPPHPDDPDSATRKVDLKSGSYQPWAVGADFSPLPFDNLKNLKLGYRAVFPQSETYIREGLSKMEWYEYGAYAGTYSRVKLPKTVHNFRVSWKQPFPLRKNLSLFIEPGLSYDLWKVKIMGGWDRYLNEEPMLEDKIKSETLNPFVKVGLSCRNPNENLSLGLNLFWKQENIKGDTPHGDIELEGDTYGLELIVGF
jgi:hypothetical protein